MRLAAAALVLAAAGCVEQDARPPVERTPRIVAGEEAIRICEARGLRPMSERELGQGMSGERTTGAGGFQACFDREFTRLMRG